MALTLTRGSQTINTGYTAENGGIKYVINSSVVNGNLQSVSAQIIKVAEATETTESTETNVGSFSKYGNNDISCNFNSSLTTAEKSSMMSDIDDIINQLTA